MARVRVHASLRTMCMLSIVNKQAIIQQKPSNYSHTFAVLKCSLFVDTLCPYNERQNHSLYVPCNREETLSKPSFESSWLYYWSSLSFYSFKVPTISGCVASFQPYTTFNCSAFILFPQKGHYNPRNWSANCLILWSVPSNYWDNL